MRMCHSCDLEDPHRQTVLKSCRGSLSRRILRLHAKNCKRNQLQGDRYVATRVGQNFGKYKINRLLGAGGMGEVYEAVDTSKGRTVALKILSDQYSQDERFRERFQRESRAAAILQEPHVIPIHDWGEVDEHLYIDMRLVPGHTLHDMLRAGPLEPERAVTITGQVASALDAAHAAGLIHRDIKPQNIIVTPEDFAYLVDFGIAEAHGDSHLTMTGTQVGSMAYMAPERFGNDEATSAVDVYALACVLCEALTGNTPFRTDSLEQAIGAHISTPPPRPSAINPRVPAALDDVVARGMAKQPDDRYGSAGAFGRAATRALTATGSSAAASATMAAPYAASVAPTSLGPDIGRQPAYMTGPTEIVAPQSSLPRGRWVVPTIIGVVGALLLGGIGIVIGMLAGRDNHSAASSTPATGYAPPSISTPQAQTPPSAGPQSPPGPPPGGRLPPVVLGADNSARHERCDAGWSMNDVSGWGTRSGRGSAETSCFFARSVLTSYWHQYGNASREVRTVSAPGAVDCRSVAASCDGSNFVMHCGAYEFDDWITCVGGNNARVYLY
jgi:serine/threonine protein kinase